jgi:hypothetical protein
VHASGDDRLAMESVVAVWVWCPWLLLVYAVAPLLNNKLFAKY